MEFISCLANSSLHLGSWLAEWDPHGGTAGLYQKLVCECQCPVLVQVTSSSCRLSVLVCLLGFFVFLLWWLLRYIVMLEKNPS